MRLEGSDSGYENYFSKLVDFALDSDVVVKERIGDC